MKCVFASNSQHVWFVCVCMVLLLHALIWMCNCVCVCFLSTSGSEIQIRVFLKSSLLGYTRHSLRNKHPKAQSDFFPSSCVAATCWLFSISRFLFVCFCYKEAANLKFTLIFSLLFLFSFVLILAISHFHTLLFMSQEWT